MNTPNRRVWIVAALILGTLLLLSLFAAPQTSRQLRQGSTYSRTPDGYGAWFAYLEQQGTPAKRWERPFSDLQPSDSPATPTVPIAWNPETAPPLAQAEVPRGPITLVGISPFADRLFQPEEWVDQGNILVIVGTRAPVTAAPFSSVLDSPTGGVKVETRRRQNLQNRPRSGVKSLLNDSFGSVVWEEARGKGKVIYVSTPYLGANAYQNEPGNFKFLADLVTQPGYPVYVDEYIHGHRDQEAIAKEKSQQSWVVYLLNTPVVLLALQTIVILLVLLWGRNQRLGPPIALETPKVDNSKAYIQALGSVLLKAECSEFVLETVGKAEQLVVQRSLGLGDSPLEPDTLVQAWVQQTGRPASELQEMLRPLARKRRISERDLLTWLDKVRIVHRHLP